MKIYLVIKNYWYEGDYVIAACKTEEGAKERLEKAYKNKECYKRKSPNGVIMEIELEK